MCSHKRQIKLTTMTLGSTLAIEEGSAGVNGGTGPAILS